MEKGLSGFHRTVMPCRDVEKNTCTVENRIIVRQEKFELHAGE